jgi:hypothetical protein
MSNSNSLPSDLQLTIAALRGTIVQLEQSGQFAPDDAALVTLKSLLLTRIAELEALHSAATASDGEASSAALPAIDPPAPPAAA